ncbi:Trehalose-phosphatase [Dillenia turbinata]|uniref:Trehalose 6-phosphate phosphatase n=1 Tax=Dillenia turbinata TaxID=194707 RepID=A0AAN8UZQ7_9MAGN
MIIIDSLFEFLSTDNMGSFAWFYQVLGIQRRPEHIPIPKVEPISKSMNDDTPVLAAGNGPVYIKKANYDHTSYTSWLMKHPSALSLFDHMMTAAKGKRIAIFLDYDGTLSPIVADPDQAFMPEKMRSAVNDVASRFPTAIISGRSLDKLYEFVRLTNVCYAGSHGMDIMAPTRLKTSYNTKYQTKAIDIKGDEVVLFQPAQEFLPAIQEVLRELEEETKLIPGVIIENNKFCISVHFRQVQEEDYTILEDKVKAILEDYPLLRLTRGKKVMEIRPLIKWDKGHALEYLLEFLGFGKSNDVLPIYIGDDQTDEDAFKVIQSRGQGYPILVSSIPKDTGASYSLHEPMEVLSFLLRLIRWKENSSRW